MNAISIPNPLLPGDTIGVMAPSSYVEKDDIERSKAALEARGYKVYIHPQTYARHNQTAGTHEQRVKALHELWDRADINTIWAAGGGNRSLYLLESLDYDLFRAKPKNFVGFSDSTSLLNAICARSGLLTVHGQVFKNLYHFRHLGETLALLAHEGPPMPLENPDILNPGEACGPLVGGCLSLFQYLPGTPDCPHLEGALLFLEDSSEHLSRIDRMFAHMKRLGVFQKISGLILGEFHDLKEGTRPFGFTMPDIVLDCLDGRDIPVIMNAPFGHGSNLFPLPLGMKMILNTKTGQLSGAQSETTIIL
ncbi:MAG: LD-carboxypeptidase [Alphaproteobacteria bacterium]|nr:LD-carboxypeptidase [Alphaproteobacteria bacterium]